MQFVIQNEVKNLNIQSLDSYGMTIENPKI